MGERIAIIGAGIAGLASAIRLALPGSDVQLFEKNSFAGGKLGEKFLKDFRFDTGPSLLTLPELLEDLFNHAAEDINEYLQLHKLENICRYFYHDDTIIDALADADQFAGELEQKTGIQKNRISSFLKENQFLFDLTSQTFLFSPFQKYETFLTPEAQKIGRNLHKLHFLQRMHSRNRRKFRNPAVTQLFDRYATYNGSNPYKAPATLNMIAHLEHNIGAFLPVSGMYSIISSLTRLAEKKKVTIHYNMPVDEIVVEKNEVKGIRANQEFRAFRFVVNATDIHYAKASVLKKVFPGGPIPDSKLSSSALIFFWGIKGSFPELDVHNILFSNDYRAEFVSLFRKFEIHHDPTIYIYISAKVNKKDAPDGCENWFVMVNAPPNTGQDWNKIKDTTRKVLMQKIEQRLGIEIEKHLLAEDVYTPENIQWGTNSWKGALYGANSNSIFSAFNRPANFSRKIKGLFFAGGSVHPGGGIPLCLASAKIVSDLIQKDIATFSP